MIERKNMFVLNSANTKIHQTPIMFVSISNIGTYDFLANEIASLKIKYFIYKFDSR